MEQIQFKNSTEEPLCLALGFFDSVHAGHRMIIREMQQYAAANNCRSAVFTFDNNAYRMFNPNGKEIYTFDERKNILASLGVDIVIHAKFDKFFKSIAAEEFLSILFETLPIRRLFCGYDYMFGNGGKGDVHYLKEFCGAKGVGVEIMPEVDFRGERVSTTLVKRYLSERNIEKANLFLTQPFFMQGVVVRGRRVGHLYDIPTANLAISKDKFLPACGVYGTKAYVDGKTYKAVTNIGAKPTFGESSVTVETLMDGLNADIYGKSIKIEFIKFIREIVKFDTPVELANQIHLDLNWRENA